MLISGDYNEFMKQYNQMNKELKKSVMIEQILNILNQEPFGMYPHKAEQIVEAILECKLIDCGENTGEKLMFLEYKDKIQKTYTRLTEGEMVESVEIDISDCFSGNDLKEYQEGVKERKSQSNEVSWQPALLTKERLYAGEEPDSIDYTVSVQDEIDYEEKLKQHNQAKEQVWFDGWSIYDKECNSYKNNKLVIAKIMFTKTVNQFVQATGTPFNENFVKQLIK